VIIIRNLYYKFENCDNFFLENINLIINKNEKIAIMGANGSGKSTLAKILNVLILPTKGEIIFDDINLKTEKDIYKVRTKVAMVFQDPDNQIISPIVCEDVAFGPENLENLSQKEIDERVDNSLKKVDMFKYKNELIENLSGGQKQKIAIAGILALNPEYIIFDESLSMTDSKSEILEKILNINKELGKSIIYITHEISEVTNFDRLIILENGKIIYDGIPKNITCDYDKLKNAKLNASFTIKFNHGLKKNNIFIKDNINIKKFVCNILSYYFRDKKHKTQ
jgi:energy-coupling factor transport system ATP-binding protein